MSARDSTASATRAWECPRTPAVSLPIASTALIAIPKKVARKPRLSLSFSTLPVNHGMAKERERRIELPVIAGLKTVRWGTERQISGHKVSQTTSHPLLLGGRCGLLPVESDGIDG